MMSPRCIALCFAATQMLAADGEGSWETWVRSTQVLHRQYKFPEAVDSAKKALAELNKSGSSDARLPATLYLLGGIYREWGHCGEARSHYARAVAIWEKQTNVKPGLVFSALVSLISEAAECDDFAAAEKLFRIHKAALQQYRSGPLDDAKIFALHANNAQGRRKYAEAEGFYRRSLEILEHYPNAKPADIAEIRNSMAVMIGRQGRLAESLKESERSVALFANIDSRHPSSVAALNNLACTLFELGRKEESERVYQRAADLAMQLFGEDNRVTARIMMNYAVLLRDKKEMPAADALKKRGMDAYRRSIVHDSQTVGVDELSIGK